MKKTLLFSLIAMSMPFVASADNMAIEKTRASAYGSENVTENRLAIPAEACGFSSPMDGTENYTIAAWLKPTDVVDGAVVIALTPQIHMNNNGNWVVTTNPNGKLSITGHQGASDHGTSAAGLTGPTEAMININDWNYVAVTVDNANLKFCIYVNGNLAHEKTMNGTLYFPAALQDGGDGPAWFNVAGYGMSALIDEVHGFNKALTAEEVSACYNGKAIETDGLTGFYTFDEQGEDGHFANTAPNAAESTDAIFNKWAGVYMWQSWINGTNTPTLATLVNGRETEAGITDLIFDTAKDRTEYYNLNGVRVNPDNVENGIYILRQGNEAKKVFIRK